jgi:hypothetical protein
MINRILFVIWFYFVLALFSGFLDSILRQSRWGLFEPAFTLFELLKPTTKEGK